MVIRKLKERIKLQIAYPEWRKQYTSIQSHEKKTFYIIGGPVHGNLGDHAIMEEQKEFVKNFFSDYECVEILMPFYHVHKKFLSTNINVNDVVCISGGGWMGDLWFHNEITIREIIMAFKYNPIIIFPQTLYYSDNDFGNKVLSETINIFSTHNNLLFAVRDKQSYDLILDKFILNGKSKACLIPDMVLYNHTSKKEYPKEKIINVCIRNDCEGLYANEIDQIKKLIPVEYHINNIDTVVPRHVSIKSRKDEIAECWKEFAVAELTITDRLHAMLFSCLNNTSCIALNNRTGKVFGVINQWMSEGIDVKCAYAVDDIGALISEMINSDYRKFDSTELMSYYSQFAELIKEECENTWT